MDAFWSGTDKNEINAWENDSWSLALVVNLFQEYKLNVSVWHPVKYSEDVRLEIIRSMPKETKKQLKEYEELCSNKTNIVSNISGWSNVGYGSQTTMWKKPTTQTDDLLKGTELKWVDGESIAPYAELIECVDEAIDDMIEEFCEGKIDYEQYSKTIDTINKQLKQKNAKISIIKLTKGSVLEKSMTMQSWEHLKYQNDKIEKIYDAARVTHYNASYGIGGQWLC
jgi:secreted Zn-dependent insulinase-like peptidase